MTKIENLIDQIGKELKTDLDEKQISILHSKFDLIEKFAGLSKGHDVDHDSGGGVGHHIHHHSKTRLSRDSFPIVDAQQFS